MNPVLRVMGKGVEPRIKPSSDKQVQALPDLLSQFPGMDLEGDGESIPVPRPIAKVFDKLIKTAVQEKGRSREEVASLLTDDGNRHTLAVDRWIKSRGFFVRWAHLGDKEVALSDLPSDELIREHVGAFDELFDGVITAFFDLRRSVDDLLADINSLEEIDGE